MNKDRVGYRSEDFYSREPNGLATLNQRERKDRLVEIFLNKQEESMERERERGNPIALMVS